MLINLLTLNFFIQGKAILNDARKAEEQLNSLRKLNSTIADDCDGDVTLGELGTRSGNLKRGQNKGGYFASNVAVIVAPIFYI